MQKRMNTYINTLCGSNIEALDKIISAKYKEFVHFYRLVEDISDDTESLCYDINAEDLLSVELIMTDSADIKKVEKTLRSRIKEQDYSCKIQRKKGKKLLITIALS